MGYISMKYEFVMRCLFGFWDLIKFKYQTTLCHSLRIRSPPEVLRTHCLGAMVSHMWGCVVHNYKHVVITVLFVLCFSDSHGFSWSAGVKTKGTEIKFRCCCFSLVPRPDPPEKEGLGIHCLRMRLISHKSWENRGLSCYVRVCKTITICTER